jgi:putative peptidoglycan lipid II flippase
MVSLADLDYVEMGRCLLAALTAGAATGLLAWGLADLSRRSPALAALRHVRDWTDAVILAAGIAVWIIIVKWILEKSGSALPRVALRRLGLGPRMRHT